MQKSFLTIVGLLLISSIALFNLSPDTSSSWPQKTAFDEWKREFNKNYKSTLEQKYRYGIFFNNLVMVKEHNLKFQAGKQLSELAVNQFSDLTVEEFRKTYLAEHTQVPTDFVCNGPLHPKKDKFDASFTVSSAMLAPTIGQQGQCASGYAFATAGAVDSTMYRVLKSLTPTSAQQLVDCSKQTQNNGCASGTPLSALNYLINRGSMRSSDYPYTGKDQACSYTAAKKIWQVDNCTKVPSDLATIKSQILQQPVIVGIDASDSSFLHYKSGIFEGNKCKTNLNHYMLAIGWGQETNTIKTTTYYLILRNSFGAKWGQNGTIKVKVQTHNPVTGDNKFNVCGVLNNIYFPIG